MSSASPDSPSSPSSPSAPSPSAPSPSAPDATVPGPRESITATDVPRARASDGPDPHPDPHRRDLHEADPDRIPNPSGVLAPWQRPSFAPGHIHRAAPGNVAALRSGARSARVVDPIARVRVEELLTDPATAHVAAPHLDPVVWALARAEARVMLLEAYLDRLAGEYGDDVPDLDDPRVRGAVAWLDRSAKAAERARQRLGLDPLSRAKLGKDVTGGALNLAQLMAQAAKDVAAREAAAAETDPPPPGDRPGDRRSAPGTRHDA